MALHLKICVAGPGKSGKSFISNLMANHGGDQPQPYDETIGCRILETEYVVDGKSTDGRKIERNVRVSVEIWDLGDSRFEKCWLSAAKSINGLILVYNPNNKADEADLYSWFRWSQEHGKLDQRQILLVANPGPDRQFPATMNRPPPPLDKLSMVKFLVGDPAQLRQDVVDFSGILFGFHPDAEFLDD